MAIFSGAQSFYLNPTVVANSSTVDVAAIGMFFMYRPSATNNRSGIDFPGITMYVTSMIQGVPDVSNTAMFQAVARAEWNAILTSSDASLETVFRFPNPVTLRTGRPYAFLWSYDGTEDFLPWTNTKGFNLVGSTNHSPGPSASYGGSYFLYSGISGSAPIPTGVQNYATGWTPLVDTDAKFKVYAARYAINSVPIIPGNTTLPLDVPTYVSGLLYDYDSANSVINVWKPSPRMEVVAFDQGSSLKQAFVGPQRVYQPTVNYPGGGVTISVVSNQSNTLTANALYSNGANFSWTDVFQDYGGDEYVVVDHGTSVDVRKVTSVVSNTVLTLDEATTVSNSGALVQVSPVAVVDSFNTSIVSGRKSAMVFLRDSSANSSVRFVSWALNRSNTSITANGSGYSNSDVLYVTGFGRSSDYPAIANLVTNGNGAVTSLAWSNVGSGFSNTANALVLVSANAVAGGPASNTSGGTGLALTLDFNTSLRTEQTNNVFRKCEVVDVPVHTVMAAMDLVQVSNTSLTPSLITQYYQSNGTSYVSNSPIESALTLNKLSRLNTANALPVIVSRSNEFTTRYANGLLNDRVDPLKSYSNCYSLRIQARSSSDWVAPGPFNSPLVDFGTYIINDSYVGEEGDSGNALARHVTTVFNFTANGHQSEDLRVYLSAWRPPNTDVQVYARVQSSADSQAFNDEDWTRLELQTNVFSTTGYVDLVYGFPLQPNTTQTLVGTVATTNGSSTITGTGTNWSNSLVANTLVKVYDPLFANADFAVCLVTAVASNTSATLDRVFSTNSAAGIGGNQLTDKTGLALDVLGFGHQAFNDVQSDNVVRYYNASEHVCEGFDTVQVKCVMLTSDERSIPRLHTLRGIGLSS